jgi:hypothetical protein
MMLKELIDNKDYEGLRKALSNDPRLANEELPYDEVNTTKAHPLHRICDGVFSKKYSDEEAVKMAAIFLEFGANVNGNQPIEKKDTPLLAAASLHADQVALLYIEYGADIHHAGCHGGTALHWAAWCGRPALVKRLILEGAALNRICIDYKATPLFWAVHGLKNNDKDNLQDHLDCVRILVDAGAEKMIPNAEGNTIFDLAGDEDPELKKIIQTNS